MSNLILHNVSIGIIYPTLSLVAHCSYSFYSVFSDSSHDAKTSPNKYLRLHVMPPFLQNIKWDLRQDSQFHCIPPGMYRCERIPICGPPSIGRYRSVPTGAVLNFNHYQGVLISMLWHDRWRYFKDFGVYRQYALMYRQYISIRTVPSRARYVGMDQYSKPWFKVWFFTKI